MSQIPDNELEPTQVVVHLRYWRKQDDVDIANGSEKGVLLGTHWPIITLKNGAMFLLYIQGDHQRALAMQAKLISQQPTQTDKHGQFTLFS